MYCIPRILNPTTAAVPKPQASLFGPLSKHAELLVIARRSRVVSIRIHTPNPISSNPIQSNPRTRIPSQHSQPASQLRLSASAAAPSASSHAPHIRALNLIKAAETARMDAALRSGAGASGGRAVCGAGGGGAPWVQGPERTSCDGWMGRGREWLLDSHFAQAPRGLEGDFVYYSITI